MDVKQLHEEMGRTWGEFKATLATQDAEIKKHGTASAETKGKLDKLNASMDEIEKRIGAVEAKGNRPPFLPQDSTQPPVPSEAKMAFLAWARTGQLTPEQAKQLRPAEQKVLTVGDQTAAGYLAPIEYVREILKGIVEFSPLRSVARVRQTLSKAIQVPKRTGVFAAQWVAESGTRTETTGLTYGLEEIPAHEAYALVDVSFAMLEDAAFDLETELRGEFAEQFGVAEGTAFISGSGVGRPEGVMTNAAVGSTVSGSATTLTADGLISLFYDIKDGYAQNATWLLKRSSLKVIRQLKNVVDGTYLWQPGLQGGQPSMILDRPFLEATDMPAIAASANPVVFGDFRRGYTIVDRIEIQVVRDPFTQAGAGNVRFHARKRVGGQVVIAEAIRKQLVSV